ncbi:MAG: helix-turn-helix transcriptional regulator [Lachnospiraceae bacterium]|nr:helix-turn-helix transcriptional regulator [Lachnospiraceae bacterium]
MSTINDRFKEIRQDHGLSQEELGIKIGLSKSGISNIENGTRNVTNKHIKLLCSAFPINEEWLRNGTEPKTIATPSSIMQNLKKEFGLDEFAYNLVYEYLQLEPKQRDAVRNFFYNVVNKKPEAQIQNSLKNQKNNDNFWESCTTEEAEAAYIKNHSKSAQKTISNVLNTTEDITDIDNKVYKIVNQ